MKKMMIASLAAAGVLFAVASQAHAGTTLDAVKKKGFVQCGISDGLPGFSYADANGKFTGIDVDICRGVAAALFGDDSKVKIYPADGERALYRAAIRRSGYALAQYHLDLFS
ncbi:amino acid ABC transporter substrate-binding protein [Kosakonia cowanii]